MKIHRAKCTILLLKQSNYTMNLIFFTKIESKMKKAPHKEAFMVVNYYT